MPKSILPSVATLVLLVFTRDLRADDDPHSLEKIAQSLASLRSRPPIVHYRLEHTVFWARGCKNHVLLDEVDQKRYLEAARAAHAKNLPFQPEDLRFRSEDLYSGINIPDQDITIVFTSEHIRDYSNGSSWSRGKDVEFEIERVDRRYPKMVHWLAPQESVCDATDLLMRAPVDRKNIEPKVFYHFRLENHSSSRLHGGGPQCFCEGGLAAPDQPFRWSEPVPPFIPEKWIRNAGKEGSGSLPTITSRTKSPGSFVTCTLRPDLHYVPARWEDYSGGKRRVEIDVTYQESADGLPTLASWVMRQFKDDGSISESTTFRVLRVERKSSIDPAVFSLDPPDGVIVTDMQTFMSYVAGRRTFKGTKVEVDTQLLSHEVRFQWFTRILAASSLLVGSLVVLIWRRFRRRRSAPSSHEQELPA